MAGALAAIGCRKNRPVKLEQKADAKPSLRLIAWGGAAGALEPCGCVSDMLGGIDHAGAWVQSSGDKADRTLFVGAGPMFFLNPDLKEHERTQALFKAEALADSLADLRFKAWAPGRNDWALGQAELLRLAQRAAAQPLAGNLAQEYSEGMGAEQLLEIGNIKVGIAGISLWGGPLGVSRSASSAALNSLKKSALRLEAKGAQLKVALIAASRGEALRLAELVPAFQVVVVGKPVDQGELNDDPIPAVVIGQTLVVQGQNHIQGMSVVDLYVREQSYRFSDGSGLELAEERGSLERRIKALSQRLIDLDGKLEAEVLNRKIREKTELERKLAALPSEAKSPKGSYFSYELVEVRESAGAAPKVAERLSAYYQRVNDHNKKAFADLLPTPVKPGEKKYVGGATCANCHQGAARFWNSTRHAQAYETLSSQHKEFNLDCVGCHVTGYDKPGGSTVTHVEGLKSVQCEACHGPGSAHLRNPFSEQSLVKKPPLTTCEKCHHQPHVGADWKASEALSGVIGPGHGQPLSTP